MDAWYNKAPWLVLLLPLSWLFIALTTFRRIWQQIITKPWQPPVPVIVIGNISLGGTGKTPLVIATAQLLVSQGYRVGIISRGYGGHSLQYPLMVTPGADAAVCGDEPVLIAEMTQCPVVVAPDRVAAAQMLLSRHDINVIISDDGLQHYRLVRTVEIVVVDGERGLGNGWCIPAGPLRELPGRLAGVDAVVINGETRQHFHTNQLTMNLVAGDFVPLGEGQPPLATVLAERRAVHAVAGIGNPDRFFSTLMAAGLAPIRHVFPDHHCYQREDVSFADTLPVVMTAKDAVKCRGFGLENTWVLPVTAQLPDNYQSLLLSCLEKKT